MTPIPPIQVEGNSKLIAELSRLAGEAEPRTRQREDQRRRWLAGERIGAEVYFRSVPDLNEHPSWAEELILAEILLREELGEPLTEAEYVNRFPEFTDSLRERFRRQSQLLSTDSFRAEAPKHGQSDQVATRPLSGWDLFSPSPTPGEMGRLGRYHLLDLLGTGGMGAVFRAWDPELHREVALKVMKPDIAARPSARERFLREARSVAALKDDHVIPIYRVDVTDGVPFIEMPLLEGETLDARLRRQGRLPPAEVIRIGREAAAGLGAAHRRGLVHRDVKPSNIWLEAPRDRVKLLDFGLARPVEASDGISNSRTIVGTPG